MVSTEPLVIGIGNSLRCDDGIGLLVTEKLNAELPAVNAIIGATDHLSLLTQWEGNDTVIVVDAIVTGSEPGTIHRIDLNVQDVPVGIRGSTHGAALADAIALAKALDRLPPRLILYGMEAKNTGNGEDISEACSSAMEQLTSDVVREVNCTKAQ
jgi:hydrogenase maturation protease